MHKRSDHKRRHRGRVCVPINPHVCNEFDPTNVPTLSKTRVAKTKRARAINRGCKGSSTRFHCSFIQLLYNAQFEELSAADLMLTSALSTDYLLTLPVYVDWKKALKSRAIIFSTDLSSYSKGYAMERQNGLLIGEDVVGNSSGTAWIKEPQAFAKMSVEIEDTLDGTPRKKSRIARDDVNKESNEKQKQLEDYVPFERNIEGQDVEVWIKRMKLWFKEVTLFRKSYLFDELVAADMLGVDDLSDKDLPIWLAAQNILYADNNNGSHKAGGYEDGHEKERYGKQARADGVSSCSRDVKEWPFRKRAQEYEEHDRKDRDRERRRSYWERDRLGTNDIVFRQGPWEDNCVKASVEKNVSGEQGEVKKEEDLKKSAPKEHVHKYQLYVLKQAIKNTIAFLETGVSQAKLDCAIKDPSCGSKSCNECSKKKHADETKIEDQRKNE
ncbi:hypothetical protein Tco_0408710 [Tanacetum coccineum]